MGYVWLKHVEKYQLSKPINCIENTEFDCDI
jgi:hypothetical protein